MKPHLNLLYRSHKILILSQCSGRLTYYLTLEMMMKMHRNQDLFHFQNQNKLPHFFYSKKFSAILMFDFYIDGCSSYIFWFHKTLEKSKDSSIFLRNGLFHSKCNCIYIGKEE